MSFNVGDVGQKVKAARERERERIRDRRYFARHIKSLGTARVRSLHLDLRIST